MEFVKDFVDAVGVFLIILYACDLLLRLHGIENELIAAREERENELDPYRRTIV